MQRDVETAVVLLTVACLSAGVQSSQQSVPAVRLDPIEGIAAAFKTHQVVMLPGGHDSKPFHDLLLSLARDKRIQAVVNDIVIEFGSSRYQDLVDRFMRGDEIPDVALRQVWQNTTIPGVTNDGPSSRETCADPSYLPMRLARIALAGLPQGEAEAVKRACAVHTF